MQLRDIISSLQKTSHWTLVTETIVQHSWKVYHSQTVKPLLLSMQYWSAERRRVCRRSSADWME